MCNCAKCNEFGNLFDQSCSKSSKCIVPSPKCCKEKKCKKEKKCYYEVKCPKPCGPYSPVYPCNPNPCNTGPCGNPFSNSNPYTNPTYNTYGLISLVNGTPFTGFTNANMYLFSYPTAGGTYTVYLPQIINFTTCNKNKLFVLSNTITNNSISEPITIYASGPDTFTDNTNLFVLQPGTSIQVYSTFIGGVGRWIIISTAASIV